MPLVRNRTSRRFSTDTPFRAIAHVAPLPVLRATIPPSPLTVMDLLQPSVAPIATAVFALVMATSPPVTLLLPFRQL